MDKIDEIHDFWFKGITDGSVLNNGKMPAKKWFMKSEVLDKEIKEKFESNLIDAGDGKLDSWKESARGCLALVLLFDQFSRNIYRGEKEMFDFDRFALQISLQTIQQEKDFDMMLVERIFLYLPLEHSESMAMQELSLSKFKSLAEASIEINPANTAYYKYTFEYAKRHYDIVEKFGRFPHRNKILGRSSTDEEIAFLKQPGSGF